ncbi:MAG TPA: D-aminoacyl-tRNA deacylase [Candidatus Bilamarchaeum sp.]|nr:D-aminoacyl-tRNA deacylase [Candidatus Bilamarchaeum sp.]
MILLFTSNNPASRNIADRLVSEQGFAPAGPGRWEKGSHALIETGAPSVLEVPMDYETDCLIVLSTHRSKIKEKIFTAHYPGNWDGNDLGGERRTLNTAFPSRLKILLQEMKREADRIGWKCGLEADHHGPTGKAPIIFVEIGSGEEEWNDIAAASAMAAAVSRALGRNERYDSFFAIGGGHYPKAFEKMAFGGPLAIGHILPKYSIDSLDADTFRQAVEKSVDKVVKVVVLKDETNLAQKEKIRKLAAEHSLEVEMV